jgi:hypothetical protein
MFQVLEKFRKHFAQAIQGHGSLRPSTEDCDDVLRFGLLSSCVGDGPSSHDIATAAGMWMCLPRGARGRTIDRFQQ